MCSSRLGWASRLGSRLERSESPCTPRTSMGRNRVGKCRRGWVVRGWRQIPLAAVVASCQALYPDGFPLTLSRLCPLNVRPPHSKETRRRRRVRVNFERLVVSLISFRVLNSYLPSRLPGHRALALPVSSFLSHLISSHSVLLVYALYL
jgi:hypothetical protein